MTKVTILPHAVLCPEGKTLEVEPGTSILQAALDNNVQIDHACEMACACTTCHVIVRKGFNSLEEASEREEDLLDKAWGLERESRLSCQAIVENDDLVIEIPKYSINQVSENRK